MATASAPASTPAADPEAAPEAPQAGLGFTETRIDADGFTLTVWSAGDAADGLPILHLHGAGGRLPSLALDLLAEQTRVIQLELPGFGDEPNTRTETVQEMAQTVLRAADALGLDAFALLGTSMGGVVACWTAVAAPDRVARLILEAPGAFRPDRNPAEMSPDEIVRAFHAHPERKRIVPEDPARMQRNWPLIERLMGPLHDDDLEEALQGLDVPALILYGEKDGLFGTEPGRVYRAAIAHSTFTIVYDAAHDIQGDRPEAFAAMVGDFVRRGREFAVNDQSTLRYR